MAQAALAVIALGMLLFYLGPALRERLKKTPPTPPAPPALTEPAIPVVPPTLPQAVDQADRISSQFIDYLKGQIEARDRRIDDLERDIARLEQDLERLRWQRGGELR